MYKLVYSSEEINSAWEKHNHYYHYLKKFYADFEANSCFPAGHYYSPIMDKNEIKSLEKIIFDVAKKDIPGIDIHEHEQVELLKEFSAFYSEIPFPAQKDNNYRYYFQNDVYSYTDAIMLYSFLRFYKPQNVIEVGSGFSSALMLDTNGTFFSNGINFKFIEPYPERLYSLISPADKASCKIYESKVQGINLDIFKELNKNDILFIDSSHVSKTGSDLNFLIFKVLPILKRGVIIHFHDIFYPFEYPPSWVYEGRNWNEAYILRAFLSYNAGFDILMFNDFMHRFNSTAFHEMPNCYKNSGGSLWIVKK